MTARDELEVDYVRIVVAAFCEAIENRVYGRLREQAWAMPTVTVDLGPDPHGKPISRQAVLLSDVLALLGGESDDA